MHIKKTRPLPARLLAGLLALTALTASAQAIPSHRTFNPKDLRLIFTTGVTALGTGELAKLDALHTRGANSLVLPVSRYYEPGNLPQTITAIQSSPVLSKYKHVISIQGMVYDGFWLCHPGNPASAQYASLCSPSLTLEQRCAQARADTSGAMLPMAQICNDLDAVTTQVQENASLFAGYYTFDEPLLGFYGEGGGHPAPAWYQVQVRNYIRAKDADIAARPVFIANVVNLPDVTDAMIQERMSADAQDVYIIDQYARADPTGSDFLLNVAIQRTEYQKRQQFNLLTKPVVLALRAFSGSCGAVGPAWGLAAIEQALTEELGSPLAIERYGLSWWALAAPSVNWFQNIGSCTAIYDEVALQLPASLDQVSRTLFRRVGASGSPSHDVMIQGWNNFGRIGLNVYPLGVPAPANASRWSNPDMGQGSPALAWLTGDVDADGDTDLIQPWNNLGQLGILVYKADATGFGDMGWVEPALDTSSSAVAWLSADFDSNGTTDVVRVSEQSGVLTLSLYRYNGFNFVKHSSGNFLLNAGTTPGRFLVGDMDGDGKRDIIHSFSASGKQGFTVFKSNGGSFSQHFNGVDTGNGYNDAPLIGHVNGDNRADIIAPWNNLGKQGFVVHTSNGTAYSNTWSWTFTSIDYVPNLLVGNTDSDPLPDLIASWSTNGKQTFRVFTANGTGGFGAGPVQADPNNGYFPELYTGDINGDGLVDLIGPWSQDGAQRFVGFTSSGGIFTNTWSG